MCMMATPLHTVSLHKVSSEKFVSGTPSFTSAFKHSLQCTSHKPPRTLPASSQSGSMPCSNRKKSRLPSSSPTSAKLLKILHSCAQAQGLEVESRDICMQWLTGRAWKHVFMWHCSTDGRAWHLPHCAQCHCIVLWACRLCRHTVTVTRQ